MKDICKENLQNIVIGHLNINSIRNKLDLLVKQIKKSIDVLVFSETKLDKSFLIGQFKILEYTLLFRLDRGQHGGGIMVFIREDIPVKFLSAESKPNEGLYIEVNVRKKKWLLSCSYNPSYNNINNINLTSSLTITS